MLETGCFMEWYCLQKQRGEKWVRYFHIKIVWSHRWECVKEITLPREVFEFQGYFSTTKKCLQNWTSPFMTAAQEQILLCKQREEKGNVRQLENTPVDCLCFCTHMQKGQQGPICWTACSQSLVTLSCIEGPHARLCWGRDGVIHWLHSQHL